MNQIPRIIVPSPILPGSQGVLGRRADGVRQVGLSRPPPPPPPGPPALRMIAIRRSVSGQRFIVVFNNDLDPASTDPFLASVDPWELITSTVNPVWVTPTIATARSWNTDTVLTAGGTFHVRVPANTTALVDIYGQSVPAGDYLLNPIG